MGLAIQGKFRLAQEVLELPTRQTSKMDVQFIWH
jgi:hypothetical protein